MPSTVESHVVIFPFMAHGHTIPVLDLSKALSCQQIKVSIITTPGNAKSISKYISSYPLISVVEIPFPVVDGLPIGCQNTSQLPSMELHLHFVKATQQLTRPFESILQSMLESETPPLCVISDFFLGWTLAVCQSFGIPRLVFHGMGVLAMAMCKSVWVHQPHRKATSVLEPLELPGINLPFTLTSADLPDSLSLQQLDNPLSQVLEEVGAADVSSWGIVVNSFQELERSHIPSFESFYLGGAKAWCLGPLCLYNKMEDVDQKNSSDKLILQFLDEQITPNSVIYVSFGTQADISERQLDEIAFGLEESGFAYVWVVRSKTWSLPNGMQSRGLVIQDWVDQRRILNHRATGGFLSHCGWNSVLESLSAGVPILAWPMIGEQPFNEKLIVDGLGAGINVKRVKNSEGGASVSREAICQGARELMGGERGRNARERAEALGRLGRRAVQRSGGSSHDTLLEMIAALRSRKKEHNAMVTNESN